MHCRQVIAKAITERWARWLSAKPALLFYAVQALNNRSGGSIVARNERQRSRGSSRQLHPPDETTARNDAQKYDLRPRIGPFHGLRANRAKGLAGQGLACHPELARRLKIDIWFCDPHSPSRQIADAIACRAVRGNVVRMRTPTDCCANTCQRALTSATPVKPG